MLRIFIVFNISRQMLHNKFYPMIHVNLSKPIVFLRIIFYAKVLGPLF